MLYPDGAHDCSQPNADAKGPAGCLEIYQARRRLNDASLTAMMARMNATDSIYLIRSMDPNGEKHGVYAPRPPCPVDEPCPVTAQLTRPAQLTPPPPPPCPVDEPCPVTPHCWWSHGLQQPMRGHAQLARPCSVTPSRNSPRARA
jgi:hypothetical protein|eukprot:COSAG01_NODE_2970_length_6775_cov_8.832235_3_plen_145_part_00